MTGGVPGRSITKALPHEHMFTRLHGPQRNVYMDVNWSNKIGAAVEAEALAVMNPAVVPAVLSKIMRCLQ